MEFERWSMMNELVQKYAAGHSLLLEALVGVSEAELNYKPAPEKWSIKEIIVHVSDAEMIAVHRMKKVIAEDNPLLLKFDPDLWSGRLHYEESDMQLYLELFKGLRLGMVAILAKLKEADWQRTGIHNTAGRQTLHDIVSMFVGHIETHVRQIERNKKALQAL
jgi:hypothetical protein